MTITGRLAILEQDIKRIKTELGMDVPRTYTKHKKHRKHQFIKTCDICGQKCKGNIGIARHTMVKHPNKRIGLLG